MTRPRSRAAALQAHCSQITKSDLGWWHGKRSSRATRLRPQASGLKPQSWWHRRAILPSNTTAETGRSRPLEWLGPRALGGGLCRLRAAFLGWLSTMIGQHYAPLLLFPLATGAIVGACVAGAMRSLARCAAAALRRGHGADVPGGRGAGTSATSTTGTCVNGSTRRRQRTFHARQIFGDDPGQPARQTGRTARLSPTRGGARTRPDNLLGQLHRPRRSPG